MASRMLIHNENETSTSTERSEPEGLTEYREMVDTLGEKLEPLREKLRDKGLSDSGP
jgi:hypothetical protein